MTIFHWLGHACFLITTLAGTPILLDPPNPSVGYKIAAHSIPAKIVFVSHSHPDHSYVEAASGKPSVVRPLPAPGDSFDLSVKFSPKAYDYLSLAFKRISAWHDNVQGKERGPDTLTVLETGDLRIAHLGDLGQLKLTPEQIKAIGRVDVLMIPVGGFFTIDGTQAAGIVAQLKPRVILPMHYQTPALNADLKGKLAPPDAFLAAMKGKANVVRVTVRDLKLSPRTLPKKPTIYLLRYE